MANVQQQQVNESWVSGSNRIAASAINVDGKTPSPNNKTFDYPNYQKPGWRKFLTFVGPGFLVSLAYLDPGNLETDLQAGANHGFELLWVVLVGMMFALIIQSLAVNLGVSTVSRLNSSLFRTYSVRPPLTVIVTIRRRHRLTPEIVESGRSNDAEFVGAIGFVRFATDRHRSDDEDLRRFGFGFVSLSTNSKMKTNTSVTMIGTRRTFSRWFCRSTHRSAVAPPLKLHQWRFGKKEEEGEGHTREKKRS